MRLITREYGITSLVQIEAVSYYYSIELQKKIFFFFGGGGGGEGGRGYKVVATLC